MQGRAGMVQRQPRGGEHTEHGGQAIQHAAMLAPAPRQTAPAGQACSQDFGVAKGGQDCLGARLETARFQRATNVAAQSGAQAVAHLNPHVMTALCARDLKRVAHFWRGRTLKRGADENEIEREVFQDRQALIQPDAGALRGDALKHRQHDQQLRQPAAGPKRVALQDLLRRWRRRFHAAHDTAGEGARGLFAVNSASPFHEAEWYQGGSNATKEAYMPDWIMTRANNGKVFLNMDQALFVEPTKEGGSKVVFVSGVELNVDEDPTVLVGWNEGEE